MKISQWIAVGASEADMQRVTPLLMNEGSDVRQVRDFNEIELSSLRQTVVRFYGRARSQALVWLGPTARVPAEVAILGLADMVLIDEQGGAPKAVGCFGDAMVASLAGQHASIDRSGSGLVVGATDDARSFISGLSRIGLRRILIVDSDDGKAESLAVAMRRRELSVEIEPLSRSYLTQLASEAAIAVNFADVEERDLIEDVSYLNFLLPGGAWLDWTGATREIGLAEEIQNAGAVVLDVEHLKLKLEQTCIAEAQAYSRGSR
ncbi:MAG: hypothetical protein JNJ49_03210 [Bdellovibrionaceae bacterium]|nr:hypothetical protein [Pseudobdellovibrionaceae bacterium]